MPVTLSDKRRIFARTEMTDRDFDDQRWDWLYACIESDPFHPAFPIENDRQLMEVISFFDETMRGPVYIVESGSQGHGGYMTASLCPIIIHPYDRKDAIDYFIPRGREIESPAENAGKNVATNRFVPRGWTMEPAENVGKNVNILLQQAAKGYRYDNPAMALLLEEIRGLSLPVVPNAADIDRIAIRLWPKPVKPPVGLVAPESKLPRLTR
jgi:hypothetical protein